MIESVRIESDEDGFHLILEVGDTGTKLMETHDLGVPLNLRLSQDAALELRKAVRETIDEWWAEAEGVRADFDRYQRTGEAPYYVQFGEDALARSRDEASGPPLVGGFEQAYQDDAAERMREQADLERKRRKEEGR